MRDSVVIRNLQKRNFDFSDVSSILRYEAVERLPRVLDKEPKRIKLKRVDSAPIFGCKQEFVIAYTEMLKETSGELYTLDLNKVQRYCDKEVFVILQTLIKQGISYNKDIATSCFDLFRIICTSDVDTLTKERVYQILQPIKPANYWGKQLYDAISFCLFGENPVILYWKDIAKYNGLYKAAYLKGCDVVAERCKTEKEVTALLKEAHKAAKADKVFMDNTYTQGISKEMIGMLYLLKDDEDKSLLNPDSSNAGWG